MIACWWEALRYLELLVTVALAGPLLGEATTALTAPGGDPARRVAGQSALGIFISQILDK